MSKTATYALMISLTAVLAAGTTHAATAQEFPEYGVKVGTVAENLEIPWAMVFPPDGRIFVTERTGQVRVIENGTLKSEPMLSLRVGGAEGGLLGMALHPEFEENHSVYLYYTYSEFLSTYNRISKFTESDNRLTDETVLVDKIPGAAVHDGGRLRFGPDGKLYATTGDAANARLAQDLSSLAGKILRINPDGTIPEDNPFAGSPVYSYGHRNPQGLDWDPKTGALVSAEHGPSGERGFAHDEINIVKMGHNYGWPEIIGDESDPKFESPLFHTGNVAWAPSGASFYDNDKIQSLKGKLLVATLRGVHLHVFEIDAANGKVLSEQPMFTGTFGRIRDVSVDTDGNIYLLTSNRDGRGSPAHNDDRILRITPISLPSDGASGNERSKTCPSGFVDIIKASNGNTACVTAETKIKLIERGWAKAD